MSDLPLGPDAGVVFRKEPMIAPDEVIHELRPISRAADGRKPLHWPGPRHDIRPLGEQHRPPTDHKDSPDMDRHVLDNLVSALEDCLERME